MGKFCDDTKFILQKLSEIKDKTDPVEFQKLISDLIKKFFILKEVEIPEAADKKNKKIISQMKWNFQKLYEGIIYEKNFLPNPADFLKIVQQSKTLQKLAADLNLNETELENFWQQDLIKFLNYFISNGKIRTAEQIEIFFEIFADAAEEVFQKQMEWKNVGNYIYLNSFEKIGFIINIQDCFNFKPKISIPKLFQYFLKKK